MILRDAPSAHLALNGTVVRIRVYFRAIHEVRRNLCEIILRLQERETGFRRKNYSRCLIITRRSIALNAASFADYVYIFLESYSARVWMAISRSPFEFAVVPAVVARIMQVNRQMRPSSLLIPAGSKADGAIRVQFAAGGRTNAPSGREDSASYREVSPDSRGTRIKT